LPHPPPPPPPPSGFHSDEYLETHRNNKQLFRVIICPTTFKKLNEFDVLFDCDWDVMQNRNKHFGDTCCPPFRDVEMKAAGCIA